MPAARLYIPEREVARILGGTVDWLRARPEAANKARTGKAVKPGDFESGER